MRMTYSHILGLNRLNSMKKNEYQNSNFFICILIAYFNILFYSHILYVYLQILFVAKLLLQVKQSLILLNNF